ncbi:hypothetical protein E3N88_12094 [Mikania micrantha]|uniref:Reverse transcriptase Ty1/copia-type domain-containing protein n=1 Tax=Mikania micrantha TaxID=192012 RepID=A0A5N6P7H8_9ASTR|nr:hypothetical protein E3N88_12094 [Mikania micrantha]
MHQPTNLHWAALKRLLCYLDGTLHHGLLFRCNSPLHLHAFTDADWAGDKQTYRSTTGYLVYLGSNLIAWSSKRQPTLTRSSTEAEFRAIASTTPELQWIISLLSELGYKSSVTPTVYCDNLYATHYSANPVFHSRMKHLALDFHFVREKVNTRTIRVTHIHADDQLADALTKMLLKPCFSSLLSKIGLLSRGLRLPNLEHKVRDSENVGEGDGNADGEMLHLRHNSNFGACQMAKMTENIVALDVKVVFLMDLPMDYPHNLV